MSLADIDLYFYSAKQQRLLRYKDSIIVTFSDLKRLNLDQLEQAEHRAVERVKRQIGERPTRVQFRRETGLSWTLLDGLALIVFLAALGVSSAHIVTHMGLVATRSYNGAVPAGIVLSLND